MSFIVCAWYTPDYARWAERFKMSASRHCTALDLVEVEKPKKGRESVTRLKAKMALSFFDNHPGKTIILSDVDAEVIGDLSPLSRVGGDIGLRIQTKRVFGRTVCLPRSGTVVINPTTASRHLLHNWVNETHSAMPGDTDEACLMHAISKTPLLSLTNLSLEQYKLISHSRTSLTQRRVTNLERFLIWGSHFLRAS